MSNHFRPRNSAAAADNTRLIQNDEYTNFFMYIELLVW